MQLDPGPGFLRQQKGGDQTFLESRIRSLRPPRGGCALCRHRTRAQGLVATYVIPGASLACSPRPCSQPRKAYLLSHHHRVAPPPVTRSCKVLALRGIASASYPHREPDQEARWLVAFEYNRSRCPSEFLGFPDAFPTPLSSSAFLPCWLVWNSGD
jgi:hypothetical protein